MDQAIIDKVKACRKIIEDHRSKRNKDVFFGEELTTLIAKTKADLASYGFNSDIEYSNWDLEQCFQAYCECRPLSGSCDKCVEYAGEPPCKARHKGVSCFYNDTSDESMRKQLLFSCFRYYCDSENVPNKNKHITYCPVEGRGFYVNEDNCTKLPFDITWRMSK